MVILDTNMFLRFMLRDNLQMSLEAAEIINHNEIFLPTEIAAEIVYVLSKVYKITRENVSEALFKILQISNIKPADPIIIKTALNIYKDKNLDFADCLLIAYHRQYGYDVCTFDKKLFKALEQGAKIE